MSSQNITCYDFDGAQFPNNFQCPGSGICCGSLDQCTENLFCNRNGLIRPTCDTYPWTSACSQICQYQSTSGFLPRVTVCADGSFCCDNNPPCCEDQQGVFLNAQGQILFTDSPTAIPPTTTASQVTTPSATPSSTSSPSASSSTTASSQGSTTPSTATGSISTGFSSSTTASAAFITITASPVPQQPNGTSTNSSRISAGAIAGISVGSIAIIVLVIAAVVFFLRRQKKSQRGSAAPDYSLYQAPRDSRIFKAPLLELSVPLTELPGQTNSRHYSYLAEAER